MKSQTLTYTKQRLQQSIYALLVPLIVLISVQQGHAESQLPGPDRPPLHDQAGTATNLSALTRDFLLQWKKLDFTSAEGAIKAEPGEFKLPQSLEENHITGYHQGIPMVSGLALVDQNLTSDALSPLGISVNTRAGNIWSLQLPVTSIATLEEIPEIHYFDLDIRMQNTMEDVRELIDLNTDGMNDYTTNDSLKSNVIYGIIDRGMDVTHPNFYTDTSAFNIVNVWDQHQQLGLPHFDFGYGQLLNKMQTILAWGHDIDNSSHGAHIAGVATGMGVHDQYKGVVPGGQMVFVSTTGHQSRLLDGVKHTFNYADDVDKPAIANLSWGNHFGPHDGTSLFNRAIDELSGPGRIVVTSAGNDGNKNLNLAYEPENNQDELRSFITFDNGEYKHTGAGYLNIWGAPLEQFEVYIVFWDHEGNAVASTKRVRTTGTQHDTLLRLNNKEAFVRITPENTNINNYRSNALISIENPTEYIPELVITSTDKSVHAWNTSGTFTNVYPGIGELNDRIEGTSNHSISSNAAGKEVISVGAYNKAGELESYSSIGPTLDGRIKPDITAPGSEIISSVSSFDKRYDERGSKEEKVEKTVSNEDSDWHFARKSGTSIAAAVVTSVIGLMLEENPTLTPVQIKNIFRNSESEDESTGELGANGSNEWGMGKINAVSSIANSASSQWCKGENFYTDRAATIDDGSGEGTYMPQIDCNWLIKPEVSGTIELFFNKFDLNEQDTLHIYELSDSGEILLASFTGNQLPPDISAEASSIKLKFTTHNPEPRQGWSISYCVRSPEPELSFSDGIISMSDSLSNIQWYVNGSKLPGENGNQLTPEEEGYYHVVANGDTECAVASDSIHYSAPTNLQPSQGYEGAEITVFPNPVGEKLRFTTKGIKDEALQVNIIDPSGREFFSTETESGHNGHFELTLPVLPEGLYFVQFNGQSYTERQRIYIRQ